MEWDLKDVKIIFVPTYLQLKESALHTSLMIGGLQYKISDPLL